MAGFGQFLSAGILIGFFHGVVPNHWIPLLAIARTYGWSGRKLLSRVAVAALSHAGATLVVAGASSLAGSALAHLTETAHRISGVLILVLAVAFLLVPSWFGHRHIHHPECPHPSSQEEKAATATVIGALVFSPCHGLASIVFGAGTSLGWAPAFLVAFLSTAVTAVTLMATVLLGFYGFGKVLSRVPEAIERAATIIAMVAIGSLMLFGSQH
ncbi:MAG: hypothetical protein NZ959_09090 [Armatimonadetes bacterium]|nr:hypothetical protein [Armatimonadota bacterium]MDW8122773.1 hypothetical protein [Armatimonadota bacterium]